MPKAKIRSKAVQRIAACGARGGANSGSIGLESLRPRVRREKYAHPHCKKSGQLWAKCDYMGRNGQTPTPRFHAASASASDGGRRLRVSMVKFHLSFHSPQPK